MILVRKDEPSKPNNEVERRSTVYSDGDKLILKVTQNFSVDGKDVEEEGREK
jgi:hypothetical protein